MKKLLVVMVLTLVMVWGIGVKNSSANYIWQPTDGDVQFVISGTNFLSDDQFVAMFDAGADFGNDSSLTVLSHTISFSKVFIYPAPDMHGPYSASLAGSTIELSETNDFELAYYNGNSWSGVQSAVAPYGEAMSMYNVTFTDGTIVAIDVDAQTVPIPAAIWLLGSGLLGLVGIRRRFKSDTEYDVEKIS